MALFPAEVMRQKHGYMNFAQECVKYCEARGIDPSAVVDPDFSDHMRYELGKQLGLDWPYGGYMEDRSIIWAKTYLKLTGNFLHLGADYSVPAGTETLAVRDGEILHIGDDSPLEGGWGGHVVQKITVEGEPLALIYAHLNGSSIQKDIKYLMAGDPIGYVGNKYQNGFWAPHVHLQLLRRFERIRDWHEFMTDGDQFDGYGHVNDRAYWEDRCPDPTSLAL